MQSDLHQLWGNSYAKGDAFNLGKEISEQNLPFWFPRGQWEITQSEPGAQVKKPLYIFMLVLVLPSQCSLMSHLLLFSRIHMLLGLLFVCSLLVILLPL